MTAWRADINPTITTGKPLTYIILSDESDEYGYYIFEFNSNDEVLFGDTFYISLEEAKFHCKELYQIDEDSWHDCPDPDWSNIKAAPDQ